MSPKSTLLKLRTLYQQLPRTSYAMLNRRLPLVLARAANVVCKALISTIPRLFLRLIPLRFRYLILMSAHALNFSKRKIDSILNLQFHPDSLDLVSAFVRSRSYFMDGIVPDFRGELESSRELTYRDQNQVLHSIMQWAFWNLNHSDFNDVNNQVKSHILSLPKTGEEQVRRFLPQHVTNLGHIAMLFLYINYYRERDPNRIIVLPKVRAANKYFLDLIVEQSPMRIEFEDSEVFQNLSPTMIDTLHYSLDQDGSYRTESDCAFYSNQDHPEFIIKQEFVLTLSEEDRIKGKLILESELGREIDWFVALHVREPKNRDLKFSQARDANISSYSNLSREIQNRGGLVIRMGDKNFPKLNRNFPAFDYAYSRIKSDFMDVWLWANCRFWVGTVNGAAFPPIAFRRNRFLADQWYWYNRGPSGDVALTKHLVHCEGKKVYGEELLKLKFSRCMDRAFAIRSGYQILEIDGELKSEIFSKYLSQNEFIEHESIKLNELSPYQAK